MKQEDVSSCWVTLWKWEDTADLKRKYYITLCGELALEEAVDLSSVWKMNEYLCFLLCIFRHASVWLVHGYPHFTYCSNFISFSVLKCSIEFLSFRVMLQYSFVWKDCVFKCLDIFISPNAGHWHVSSQTSLHVLLFCRNTCNRRKELWLYNLT